jgi:quercetin dioxygenase-like cupin family protein
MITDSPPTGASAMTTHYTHFSDLVKEVQPPDKGILSRTLYSDNRLKVVAFGFAQGEELSEHTASMPAVMHFLQGAATMTLGDDHLEAKPGTWAHLSAGLKHSIQARTPVVMLLMLLR